MGSQQSCRPGRRGVVAKAWGNATVQRAQCSWARCSGQRSWALGADERACRCLSESACDRAFHSALLLFWQSCSRQYVQPQVVLPWSQKGWGAGLYSWTGLHSCCRHPTVSGGQ